MRLADQLIFHEAHSLLEQELGADLQLPRGAAITGGESC